MLRRPSVRILAGAALLALAAFPVAGCGGGGGTVGGQAGSTSDRDLAVTYFNLGGRTDVYRNQRLELRFTTVVKKNSVTSRTIRVLTGPQLQTPVDGALIVDGNKVYFEPTVSQHYYDLLGKVPDIVDRPFGFEALANHQIFVPAYSSTNLKTLTNRAGKPLVKEFVASFTTSEFYEPELEPPEFVGIDGTGSLGFLPDKNEDGSVPFDAQIILEFSEPIDPGSMDPGNTVLVKNEDVRDFQGKTINIPGTFRPSADGRTYFFVPSFHYGTGPYRISVTLTQGIHDLAGNPLANPRTLFFETEENLDVDTISTLTESFSSNFFEDFANTTADWNTVKEGELRGGPITTTVVKVHYIGDNVSSRNLLVDYPLVSKDGNSVCPSWPNGIRVQEGYSAADIGVVGAVTEIYWNPASHALFAATHPNIKIRIGHTKDTQGVISGKFEDNFKEGMPLPQFDGPYYLPQDADINNPPGTDIDPATGEPSDHFPFPALTSPFDYNGTNGLLIDWQVDGANDCQLLNSYYFGVPGAAGNPGNRNIVARSKNGTVDDFTGGGQPLIYDMAFKLKRRLTFAQSKFYNTAQPKPNYGAAIISPPSQAGGASYTIEWQGADGMPNPSFPSQIIPDPSTYTPWSSTIDVADNKQFIRYRIVLIANLNSNTVPRFDQIQIPFSFRPAGK